MARLELVATIVVALCAIVLEAEALKDWCGFADDLEKSWVENLQPSEAGAEEAYSYAASYLGQVQWSDKPYADELLKAWHHVLYQADQCDSSLEYVATISRCKPGNKRSMKALHEATKKYARKCLTPEFIDNESKLRAHRYFYDRYFAHIADFIDDPFIADYWSDRLEDKPVKPVEVLKATKAIAKALVRGRKYIRKDARMVKDELTKRFYRPCLEYSVSDLREVGAQLDPASEYLEGGYAKLILSLDKDTQDAIFRYQLCSHANLESNAVFQQVLTDLGNLISS